MGWNLSSLSILEDMSVRGFCLIIIGLKHVVNYRSHKTEKDHNLLFFVRCYLFCITNGFFDLGICM